MATSHHKEFIDKVSSIFKVTTEKTQVVKVIESVSATCYYLEVETSQDQTKKIFVKIGEKDVLSDENKHVLV